MTRYRIQTRTTAGGRTETHVSSVILTHAEALDSLDAERLLARAAGWHTVTRGDGLAVELVCIRGRNGYGYLAGGATVRTLTIRQSDPFDDTLSH